MAMQTDTRQDGEPTSEINTTPLIDVMLVLLVMLIVTLPPQHRAVTVETPTESPPAIGERSDTIRIGVDFDGAVSWNGERVGRGEWEHRLTVAAHRNPQPEIHVEPSPRAAYGHVAAVMSSAQREGLTRMGVVGGT